jgi:replication-associated recombination protein RarA
MTFFFFSEGGNVMNASFSYDEQKKTFDDVYDFLIGLLNDNFKVSRKIVECYEITMCQFIENMLEARRRENLNYPNRMAGNAHLWYYAYYLNNDMDKELPYRYDEKIIDKYADSSAEKIYDSKFIEELRNIEAHPNDSELSVNMVHYIISGRSIEATSDMVSSLARSLIKSNRLQSSRMEIISEIAPNAFNGRNYFEDIIENNFGGVIVFDLTERFGDKPEDYVMTARYIENLVKKYKNKCLFVFTYDMDNPGFSYLILPELKKYIIPIALKEGTVDRKTAIGYLKTLIKKSEYAKYANQANEFMKQYPETKFTQTDIIRAHEQFEMWCLNKNVLSAYNLDFKSDFMLDRDENTESSYEKLQKMVGLNIVKKQIDSIIASNLVEKERKNRRGSTYNSGSMHMVFGGNPGSAKTTVAKLFAGIAKEKGILKSGTFVERGGMDLDGWGCVKAIRDAFIAARGGVLFIDEAYSMKSDTAVTVLLQEMENQRDNVIVILAGYNKRMQDFMELNEGLKSRIPHWIEFPDYTADELTDIFKMMLSERGFTATDDAVSDAHYIFEKARNMDNFGNGRYVRNLIEHVIKAQSVRLLSLRNDVKNIKKNELFTVTKEDIKELNEDTKDVCLPGDAKQRLEQMVGLSSVKKVINKAIANFKINKLCMERGIAKDKASLHMVFTGNPGTAKTTVARLFAEILKAEKVLSSGTFVEVGRADLVGNHVGSTAPLVKKKFKEAQGGVLFIDEAYSLCDSYTNGFGDEAINTLVQEMENHRDDVIVIFAGYPEPMKEFLDRNPGMKSRIAFQVQFEDYTVDELVDITKLMVSDKNMTITENAIEKLRRNFEIVNKSNDYGNGRYVRKMVEEAEMNLAERLLKYDETDITDELLITIEAEDIPEVNYRDTFSKPRIGFAC